MAGFDPPESFNLADYLLDARVREGRGDRVALRLPGGAMTYAEVQRLANRFAAALVEMGVRREERVLLALPDGAEFVGALFGCLKRGAVGVMVNPDLEPERLAELLDYTGARLAIVDRRVRPAFESAREAAATRPGLLVAPGAERDGADGDSGGGGDRGRDGRRVGGGRAASGGVAHFAELDAATADGFETRPTHRDDPALWLFSGGTTGRPKGVVQSHASFANTTECYAKAGLGYSEDDVTISVPKLFFGYATGSNLFFPFAVGGSAVLFPEHPTPEVLFDRIERYRPTILVNVPKMVSRMVGHPDAAAQNLSSLRFATSAGEALPAPLYERWKATFGVELLDGLGTAEMWHIFLSNLPGAVTPGTLGRVVPGFEIRVCDEDGREVPDGEVGRLWVRGRSRAVGYWRDMAKTAECFRGEWFVGGDLVSRDADGWVTYCGRSDDVLKVSGKWLAPQEVESCLTRHPAVAECAVVGIENAEGLTEPVAFVVATESREGLEAELQRFVLDHLQPYKHPRRVHLMETLPRTHLGKVDRTRLRQIGTAPAA